MSITDFQRVVEIPILAGSASERPKRLCVLCTTKK